MSIQLTWYGHAAIQIEAGDHTILFDPYIDDSPLCNISSDELNPTHILVTHGHADHIGDTVKIAKRTGAQVIAIFEVANWLARQGVKNVISMNIGGEFKTDFGSVRMTNALHSSSLPDGSYGGSAAGFVITVLENLKIYHAGDTGMFGGMQVIGNRGIDVAMLPIGDRYTMGPLDSIKSLSWLKPKRVIPLHYGTWDQIKQDAEKWGDRVKTESTSYPVIPEIGKPVTMLRKEIKEQNSKS